MGEIMEKKTRNKQTTKQYIIKFQTEIISDRDDEKYEIKQGKRMYTVYQSVCVSDMLLEKVSFKQRSE